MSAEGRPGNYESGKKDFKSKEQPSKTLELDEVDLGRRQFLQELPLATLGVVTALNTKGKPENYEPGQRDSKLRKKDIEPNQEKLELERRIKIERTLTLVEKFNRETEVYPFVGIDPEVYKRMKQDDIDYPGFTTPIDEILQRLNDEGMKVVTGEGDHLESGNIYVLPASTDDTLEYGTLVEKLLISDGMDSTLRELIELRRNGGIGKYSSIS
jgi:hypothetical protein